MSIWPVKEAMVGLQQSFLSFLGECWKRVKKPIVASCFLFYLSSHPRNQRHGKIRVESNRLLKNCFAPLSPIHHMPTQTPCTPDPPGCSPETSEAEVRALKLDRETLSKDIMVTSLSCPWEVWHVNRSLHNDHLAHPLKQQTKDKSGKNYETNANTWRPGKKESC